MEETTGRITIGEADKTHLTTAAKWAKFVAIVQFVGIGLGLLSMFFMLLGTIVADASFAEMTRLSGMPGMPPAFWISYSIFMLMMMAAAIFLSLYLLYFATNTLRAVKRDDTAAMTGALANLGRYFRLTGILFILTLVLAPLMAIGIAIYMGV